MKRKMWIMVIISIGIIMTACGEKEAVKKGKDESERIEQEKVREEITEVESGEEEEKVDDAVEYPEETQEDSKKEILYNAVDYGDIEEYGGEFYYDEDNKGFYYHIECFYLNSDFLYTMNDTLEKFYDEYLKQYLETQDWYMEQGKQELPEGNVPYSKLLFQGVQYVDNDYISLLFNDVTYMGSANAYSRLDAITLDRHTGKEVKASEILGINDLEILDTVNELMGLDEETDWENLDFFLEEEKIVFFYRIPGFWDDLVLGR